MAKKQSDGVYRIIDVVGVSEKSWEDAGRVAVETAASSLRDLRIAEVTKMDMKVDREGHGFPHAGGALVQIRELTGRTVPQSPRLAAAAEHDPEKSLPRT